MTMKLVGWTYIEQCMPWTKVFEVDVAYNKGFSFVPIEEMEKAFIHCDLHGFVRDTTGIPREFTYMLDMLFTVYGVNIKDAFSERGSVVFNGHFVRCLYDKSNLKEIAKHKSGSDANVTVIDNRYVYFNCTSYDFYEPHQDTIAKKLGSINLGGWLVKIGEYEDVDRLLKEIL